MPGERRLGVVGIVVERRKETAPLVNQLLTEFGDIIVGRMGVPYREAGVSVIALIVDGTTDEIGALTGRLGQIQGVTVKSALTRYSHSHHGEARERTPGATATTTSE
ncbi:MAG: CopG family transcriptional regulator [Limnochordales bacterium]|nr:CopG family transcriptional regulator [Limnochordales bacterium]